MENQIQAVIFDMDGVILDSESISKKTWFLSGHDFDLSEQECEEIFQKCIGCSRKDMKIIFDQTFGGKIDCEMFLEKCYEYFDKISDKSGIPLMPYTSEILEYLKPKYKIALASSTRKCRVIPQLTAVNVIQYFEKIVTGDMVEHSKPDPEIYLKACKEIGVSPENCYAVEDSFNGIKSAYNAGLKCIMIPDQIPANDEIRKLLWKECKNLGELREFL